MLLLPFTAFDAWRVIGFITLMILSGPLLVYAAPGGPSSAANHSQRAGRLDAVFNALHRRDPSAADFHLHRALYQEIVRAAKALPLANGVTKEKTLAGLPVLIEKDGRGFYTITMTTNALGHGGDYGYTYADAPLKIRSDVAYPQLKTLGTSSSLRFVRQRLNPHWWIVYNNLD